MDVWPDSAPTSGPKFSSSEFQSPRSCQVRPGSSCDRASAARLLSATADVSVGQTGYDGEPIQVELLDSFCVYLESMNALLSVTKFPAYVTEFRLGARFSFNRFPLVLLGFGSQGFWLTVKIPPFFSPIVAGTGDM